MSAESVIRPEPALESSLLFRKAVHVVADLQARGHIAYFAGGSVRDMLLGRPITEIDIASSALPDQVESLFPRTFPKGKAFGVISVMVAEDEFEVATFRNDGGYSDGRRPDSVSFSDAAQDAQRRDFTINGMFYDPISGKLYDYVGGRQALEAKEIRCIGDPKARFAEDKLRLLRAVRFSAQLDFSVEEKTLEALGRMADSIGIVSVERIRDEFEKILRAPNRRAGLEFTIQSGLMKAILPEMIALIGVEQGKFHPEGDVYTHTMIMMENLSPEASIELIWAALLHDIAKPVTQILEPDRIRFFNHPQIGAEMARAIGARLCFPKAQTEKIARLVADHLIFIEIRRMRVSKLKRRLADPDFADLLELHRLDALASNGDFASYDYCREMLQSYSPEDLRPPPLVTGKDLIELGFQPGPEFKNILEWVSIEQLEGRLSNPEEAIETVKTQFVASPRFKGEEDDESA